MSFFTHLSFLSIIIPIVIFTKSVNFAIPNIATGPTDVNLASINAIGANNNKDTGTSTATPNIVFLLLWKQQIEN